jgi:hypothetical protein
MQRLLIGLVLFLTASVGVLAVSVYNLSGEIQASVRRSGSLPPRDPVTAGVPPARVETLEQRMARVVGELDKLQRDWQRLEREAAAARARNAATPRDTADGETPPVASGNLDPADRPREADGDFVITDEDEAFFVALQKRVERRRRIEGMTKNVMRRVESLEKKGEIQQLTDEARAKLERVLHRYVVAGDDLVTRYVRDPDEQAKELTPEQKRDEMATARENMVAEAMVDLEALLGQADATTVGERCLRAYGGWRRNTRPGIRPRRG